MIDLIKKLMEKREDGDKVRGAVVAKLTAEEVAEKVKLRGMGEALKNKAKELSLATQEYDLKCDLWWNGIRSNHNLEQDHLQYEEKTGEVFEMIEREDEKGDPKAD